MDPMPLINDRYYANPQYGKALERARAADEENKRVHGEEAPSWLDHHLGFASPPPAKLQAKNDDKIRSAARLKDRSDRAAMSYAEKTDGTVAEHEAMQSTVMNRVASGQRQYVKKGEPVTEKNVIHAPNQY
jgi:hypothetical protein